jgi:pyruvate dehydrogenase E2 component (dihydrolipoamide acetyltransferase)
MATLIRMPQLSPTMEEGVLRKWTKKEGDKISPGDMIAEVETDKANMDFVLEDEGVLLKLIVKEGDTVKLGEPVAVIGDAGEDPSSVMSDTAAPAKAPPAPEREPEPRPSPKAEPPKTEPPKAEPKGNGRILASPFARKLAREKGIDLQDVTGTGPHGRIIARDLAKAPVATKAPAAARAQIVVSREDALVPHSQMRKTIAKRLVEAKQSIPHIYLTGEATVDRLMDLRAQLNEIGQGVKISVNDLVVKAMALALRAVPDANASFSSDGIVKHGRVDVGVAVSLPDGLITPVVRDADVKSISQLSQEVKALAERARNKKLKPEEYTGGTATVSNLGMYGVKQFEAIINPPESVILAVGVTEKRPVVVEKNGRDEVTIAQRMMLTLSCDHRTVDGVLGAQLLAKVVEYLEKPIALVM